MTRRSFNQHAAVIHRETPCARCGCLVPMYISANDGSFAAHDASALADVGRGADLRGRMNANAGQRMGDVGP
jgi:hypothetical protein